MSVRHTATAALVALLCLPAAAEVYKWVDEDGKTHYSDRPIGEDATAMAITSRPTDNARITAAKQARVEQLARESEEQAQATEEAQRNAENDARREENCRRAREALASPQNAERLYIPLEDGGRQYLDEQQVQDRRDRASKDVEEWCTG